MALRFDSLRFTTHDPERLATFWAGVLEREPGPDGDAIRLSDEEPGGLDLVVTGGAEPRDGLNQIHFDLTSGSVAEQQATVSRALALGARHLDVGQRPEEGHVVLADPEGNEFCVLGPGNGFLDGCGFLGALSCDGSRQVGLFWQRALDWPLVWDEGEETAIQSPDGGPKITWGGPPVREKVGRNRMLFVLDAEGELVDAVDGLMALGAQQCEPTAGTGSVDDDSGWAELRDPDGNEFLVRAATR